MAIEQDQYQGEWRNLPFHTISSEGDIGPRNKVHEFPFSDEAQADQFGRKARSFTLNIFVLGQDVAAQRKALEAAFEQGSEGELVHPWRGRMNCVITSCRPSESIGKIGRQDWVVSFKQVGSNTSPNSRPDTKALVTFAADHALAASATDFAEHFTVEKLPEFVAQDASSQIDGVLSEVLATAKANLPDMTLMPSLISDTQKVLSNTTQLMRLPTNLATEVAAQFGSLLSIMDTPMTAFNRLTGFFSYLHEAIAGNTNSRHQQHQNRVAIATLVRTTAIIVGVKAAAETDFESQQQAIKVLDTLVAAIDAEQLTASDNTFHALSDCRTAIMNDIHTRAVDLAKIIQYTPKATMPAAIIAYSLYGDATKETDLVTRNNIKHPGFVQGGQPLEILVK